MQFLCVLLTVIGVLTYSVNPTGKSESFPVVDIMSLDCIYAMDT